jgi:type II secretory pathway component GspD/PulD (secretin)
VEIAASGSRAPTTMPFTRDFSNIPDSVRNRYMPMTATELRTSRLEQEYIAGDLTSDPPTLPQLIDLEYKNLLDGTRFPYPDVASFTFGTLDFTQLAATLRMLDDTTDTSIISNPNVTTLNNKEAKIIVGEIFNIPTYERNDSTGRMEITGYTEKDVGIILTVVPHINEANDIVIDLKPEVTAFFAWDEFGTGTNAIFAPRFTTRTAETQIMIKDGQTIVIGGLRENETVKVNKKVPFFGDIPLVGELFKYKEDAIRTKDLLIFVTVRLVPDDRDDKSIMDKTVQDFFNVEKPEDVRYR